MMDENTKFRMIIDYTRVCVVISAVQEFKMEIPIEVDRPAQFKVEYMGAG